MQYADVAVHVRSRGSDLIFSYAIPPALLPAVAPGVVVRVPFRGRLVDGVIDRLRASLPAGVSGKLQPIKQVRTSWPILAPLDLKLRRKIAERTATPAGLALSLLLPSPALFSQLKPPALPPSQPSRQAKRKIMLGHPAEALPRLTIAMAEMLASRQTVLIVTPTKEDLKVWQDRLQKKFATQLALFHPDGRVGVRSAQAWQAALSGQPMIVAGMRSASLLPFRRLGLMIIDAPHHPQLQEEQAPYYDVLEIAKLRSELAGTDLILLGPLPPVRFFLPQVRNQWRWQVVQPSGPTIRISQRAPNSPILPTTLSLIQQTLKNGRAALVIAPRRGWALGQVCVDCGQLMRCPRCHHLLVPNGPGRLVCLRGDPQTTSTACPRCHGIRLKPFGWGTDRLADYLKSQLKLIVPVVTPDQARLISQPVELVVVIEPERMLDRLSYQAHERWLIQLWFLKSLARETFLIETSSPDQPVFQELTDTIPKQAIAAELRLRQTEHYPPFGRIVEIRLTDLTTSQASAKLGRLLDQLRRAFPNLAALGPAPDPGSPTSALLLFKLKSAAMVRTLARLQPAGARLRWD